ncbi:hypothetical protein BJF84_13410 [Rhodococcus sp. CUA-806]|nr:hypothetical protein BJF84_13410 [Rhodococcus sp. CUA-806]
MIRSATVLRAKPTLPGPNQLLPVPQGYLAQIAITCALLAADASFAAFPHGGAVTPVVIAIEGITRPNWHMQGRAAANPEPLLAAAIVLGNIQAWATTTYGQYTEIPPGGNGGAPLSQYPDTLVSDAERRKPNWQNRIGESGKLRHERSAFDVAHVAARQPLNTHTSNRP